MYRTAGSRLRFLKGRLGNVGPTRLVSTSGAVTTKAASSAALFTWLTGERSSSLPSLDFPLPGVSLAPTLPDYVERNGTMITTLSNGVRIASESSKSPVASIGLYVDCGSINETPLTCGATHLLERMAFKSTVNRSHLRIGREVEAIGGNIMASASRENISYTFDALKTYVPQMVELLIDSVRNPLFMDWEVKEQLQNAEAQLKELSKNPEIMLLEAISSAAYTGALANPLLVPESVLHRLNSTILEQFVIENYTAPRMVLSASGVEHEELLSIAKPLLCDLPNVAHREEPKSTYVGGESRCQADSANTHVALAFEVPGGWHEAQTATIVAVIQMLMGGGGSFSAGGPGKGMHSRLYLRVLNKHQRMESFSAFNQLFNNSGVFGIYFSTDPEFAPEAVNIAAEELVAIATPEQVNEVELSRAKEATKSAILMHMESRSITVEDIGKQISTYGERRPVEYFLDIIDTVTLKDITSIAQTLLSSPLTMASYGDVTHVPSYESVRQKFHV